MPLAPRPPPPRASCKVSGNRSVHNLLQKKVPTVPKHKLDMLELAPAEIINSIADGLIGPLRDMVAALPPLPLRDVATKRAELDDIIQKIPQVQEQGRELIGAIDHIRGKQKEAERTEKLHTNYLLEKAIRYLKSGGHHTNLAKHVAKYFTDQLDCDQEAPAFVKEAACATDFNPEQVSVFAPIGRDDKPSIIKYTTSIAESLKEFIDGKEKTLSKTMAKRDWASAMIRFEAAPTYEEFPGFEGATTYMQQRGAEPWLYCVKANSFKYSASELPLPGFAQVFAPLHMDCTVIVYEVASMLEQGISVADLPSFIGSPSGVSYLKEKVAVVRVSAGGAVWIPLGFVATVCHIADSKEATVKDPYQFGIFLSVLELQAARGLDTSLWSAIYRFNMSFLGKNRQSKIWTARASSFEAFAKAVTDGRE